MDLKSSIRERCHVNSGGGGCFVGVKADAGGAAVYFPIGYQLAGDDDGLRADINNLLCVLAAFMKEEQVLEASKAAAPEAVSFPVHAYLKVIRHYLRTGRYYTETEPQYKTGAKGTVSWARTVRGQRALVQKNGSLIFTNMTVRSAAPNANKKITQIHRYCVYEAFEKMGWLYVPYMPEEPGPHPENREALHILEQKLASTHNDAEQELFSAMRAMLIYMDGRTSEKDFFFGTSFFERIWEKMIDRAFGTEDKSRYFPRARWLLDYGTQKVKAPLQPDSVMVYHGKVYLLDAKLYRFGCHPDRPDYLPNSSDINKQITYGEYAARTKGVPAENVYNAFIMPFNQAQNGFLTLDASGALVPGFTGCIGNVAEAVGDWRPNSKNYERVQGIVIDTRFLLYNYAGMPEQQKRLLAEAIEKVDARGAVPPA